MPSNRFILNPSMTETATQVLAQGKELQPIERLSVAMALLQDGDLPDELFAQLRDQVESAIAVERCKRLDAGIDEAIPYDEAMRRAKAAVL